MPYRTPESKKGGVSAPPFSMKLTQPVSGKLSYYPGVINQYYNDPTTPASLLAWYQSMHLNGHNGIDFGGVRGTPIRAAHSGLVVEAKTEITNVSGRIVTLVGPKNANGVYLATNYGHNDELLVSTNENVTEGQIIAKMGNSGSQYYYMGVHCHFGMYEYSDPVPGTYQLSYASGKVYTRLHNNNGFLGALDPLPLFNNNMKYVIIGKEQYVLDETLKLAFNIGDEQELFKLQQQGLSGSPEVLSVLPVGYLVYPLVDKARLKDIFGL